MAFNSLSRRHFGKLAALSALSAAAASAQPLTSLQPNPARRFPDNFIWGTATSAYQIEGALRADGRGPSIWESFARRPGAIVDGSNAEIASDHFHRVKEDVALMKALGTRAYRLSVAWPRVFPDGTGAANPKGLDFYNRLLDELAASGIEPFLTLYHWDLPQALEDRLGGWTSRDTAQAFADYAGHVTQHLGDRVSIIFTLNETARFIDAGYGFAKDAPGRTLPPRELNQVHHNVALAHGLAVQAIRAHGRAHTRVGLAENITTCIPAIETPANIRAAEIATREFNASYLTAILEGRYTDGFLAWAGGNAPRFTAEDLRIIAQPIDFVGLNVYTPNHYVVAADNPAGFDLVPFPASFPTMDAPWLRIGPEAMYWAPRHVAKLWDVKSIYITENGAPSADAVAPDGQIHDLDRIMYLRAYLAQLQRATAEGVPVRGYFLWTLLDNFEWSDGYAKRFGLYHVDFKTQRRTPKLSAAFYRETIARNTVA